MATKTRPTVTLDRGTTDSAPIVELVMGEDDKNNYLWLGDGATGEFFGALGPAKADLRALRRLIDQALGE